MNKVLKTEIEYKAALARIESLIEADPVPDSAAGEELALLTLLIRDFEERTVRLWEPDPVDAIQFRMEQQGLSQRDLIPFIGSRNRVSEVLSRKRPLTLAMIRALHKGLGIPASVLLTSRTDSILSVPSLDWRRFPLAEMARRHWFDNLDDNSRTNPQELLGTFFSRLNNTEPLSVLFRRTDHFRSARPMDTYALLAWTARIMIRHEENPPDAKYDQGIVGPEFMMEVARMSWSDRGPLVAIEFLRTHGISVIVEPHLPRTYLDGAAIFTSANEPIIGLTIRHDRIDYFWFCLMHELAHVVLHMQAGISSFFDDLDIEASNDPIEDQADNLARSTLIPDDEWSKSAASKLRSVEAAEALARKLRIHPAIVGGRIRYEFKSYRVLKQLVGHNEIRKLFPDVEWE